MFMKRHFLLNTIHVVVDGLYDSVPILLSFMVFSFGAGEKEAGGIISLANTVITFAGLWTIFFSRYLGLFSTFGLIVLMNGLGFLSIAFSPNLYLAGMCFIIGTAGFGVFHNLAFSFITANSARRSLGKTMGDFTAIGDIGRIPLASLAGFLAAFSLFGLPGWRIVCFTYGLGAVLLAGYIWFSFQHENPESIADDPATSMAGKFFPSFSLLRRRQYVLPISASVLDAFGSNQVFVFLPFLLFDKGIDPKVIGAFALAFTVGCLVGKTALGRLVDKYGTRKVFILSELMMAVLLVILLLGNNIFIVVGASLLLGVVTKGTVPVIQTIITEPCSEKKEYGDIFSINSFSRGIANMVTPLIFGFIASIAGIDYIFAIMAFFVVCAITPVLLMDVKHPAKEAA
ncbi:MAG TPA: MFS transporter [Negativicutes bacterium]|nr:MFS transporter [Negativicutes bacterium]